MASSSGVAPFVVAGIVKAPVGPGMEEYMKSGDTVYRACISFEGNVEVASATLTRAGPERLTLDRDHEAWRYRRQVQRDECHATRDDALRAMLEQVRKDERDYRERMEAMQARSREIEALLRTPAESSSS